MRNIKTLLLLFSILCFGTEALAYDVYIDGIFYNINKSKKTARVTYRSYNTYENSSAYKGDVVIPSFITISDNGNDEIYTVASIEEYAFYSCDGLKSVTIANSVTNIGKYAFFDCKYLTSITIPNTVTYIGKYAFASCKYLPSITLPNLVTNIDEGTFGGCSSLASFIIPNSVTSIGPNAFNGCSNLKSIDLPLTITSIGSGAFASSGITSIYLPDCKVDEYLFGSDYREYSTLKDVYCYPKAYNTLYSGYHKRLIGGPVYQMYYDATQTTLSLRLYETKPTVDVPDGWPTCSVKEASIEFNKKGYGSYDKYIITGNERAEITGLVPNKEYTAYFNIIYDDDYTYRGNRTVKTNGLTPTIKNLACGPTAVVSTGGYKLRDAHISETYFEIGKGGYNLKRFDGDNLDINGLEPNSSYYIAYHVKTTEGSDEYVSKTITTPQLELTTLQPKCVSSSCAIVAATTNIGESETNVGFQWKKFDAPASLKPSEGYAAIYGGQLEGYIKNLQATSYYNVRAFYKSADGQYFYGDWVTFDPSDFSYFEPTVHTYDVTDVTASTVKVKGYVLAGTDNITEQGFEYRPMGSGAGRAQAVRVAAAEEQAGDDVFTVFATGQVMTAELRNLKPETTYVCRAFVKTVNGTTYGEEQTFTTDFDVTGIAGVEADAEAPTVEGYYDMSGRKIDTPKRGVNIIRYTDGTARKVFVK